MPELVELCQIKVRDTAPSVRQIALELLASEGAPAVKGKRHVGAAAIVWRLERRSLTASTYYCQATLTHTAWKQSWPLV